MAGDWIKMEHSTGRKPEVMIAAEMLGLNRREVIGLFYDYFVWLDQNLDEARNGVVTHVSRKSLEETLQCGGFASILEHIKWASFDDKAHTLTVLHWDRHNGNTAKTRALGQKRASRFRNAKRNDTVTQDALPEKRRDINPIVPSPGFDRFWFCWPATPRKTNRKGCREKWLSTDLEPLADKVVAHVEAMKALLQWRSGYEPAPMTYLNQRRWEDGIPSDDDHTQPRKVAL